MEMDVLRGVSRLSWLFWHLLSTIVIVFLIPKALDSVGMLNIDSIAAKTFFLRVGATYGAALVLLAARGKSLH
jgi:Na+-transporting methylmalonyl-CoA/oxaloacetate decarboxylase beta subunit